MPRSIEDHSEAEQQLDDCKYLFLRDLSEPIENQLRFVVQEAGVQTHLIPEIRHYLPELNALSMDASPILSDESSLSFEISFASYISYTVSNESYGRYPQVPEVFIGKLFRRFSWSHLLEFTRKTSYASDQHPGPGPLLHFEVVCLNHVIDVIATEEPRIVVLDAFSQVAALVQ